MITLRTDVSGPLAGIEKMLGEDLPFTIARFLTLQAQAGQEAARAKERGVFKLRNDWTVRNTKITPAKKTAMFSEVFTDTANRVTGAPDYLPRQDEGGERVPLAGHRFIAIPTRYLFKYIPQNRPIPDNLRPKALLPAGASIGNAYAGSFSAGSRAGGTKRLVAKGTMRKLGNSEFEAFVQTTKSGTLCIFVRHGGVSYHGGSSAEPWYTLVRRAHIKARFPMEQVVAAAVDAGMQANFDKAAAEILVNNAIKSGFSVRF